MPNVSKPALDNVGFKLDHAQWESVFATAKALGQDVATFTRAALAVAVTKAGLYAYPEADPAAYRRGRPVLAVKKARAKRVRKEKESK